MDQTAVFVDYDKREMVLKHTHTGNALWGQDYIFLNDILNNQNAETIIEGLVKIGKILFAARV